MHRIVVNLQTGEVTQVEYTAEEQAAYDAAVALEAQQQAEQEAAQATETPAEGV